MVTQTLISYLSPALSLIALIVAPNRDSLGRGNVGVLLLRCCIHIYLKIPIDVLLRIGVLIKVMNIYTLQLNFR